MGRDRTHTPRPRAPIAAVGLSVVCGMSILFAAHAVKPSSHRIFAQDFPRGRRFHEELALLRSRGRVKPENEALIRENVHAASRSLSMPPALLWCLVFQESRLNHLAGIDSGKPSTGLGQFSFSSYYEINFHLERYGSDSKQMLERVLGNDPRPIGAFRDDVFHPSSYYFIPTAVAASAAYLNNRYHHLSSLLERRRIAYDADLVWFFAALAYNKGTRGVLSLWNGAGHERVPPLRRLMSEPAALFVALEDEHWVRDALEKIWPTDLAAAYGRELRIHARNLRDCSVRDSGWVPGRNLATEGK